MVTFSKFSHFSVQKYPYHRNVPTNNWMQDFWKHFVLLYYTTSFLKKGHSWREMLKNSTTQSKIAPLDDVTADASSLPPMYPYRLYLHKVKTQRTDCQPSQGQQTGRSGPCRRSPATPHPLGWETSLLSQTPRHGFLCWHRKSLFGTVRSEPNQWPGACWPEWCHKKSSIFLGKHRWIFPSLGCSGHPH